MALHHQVDVDEPDQPGLTKNQDLHTTSGAKNPLPKQKYHVRPFAVHIQGQHYRSNGRQSARGAQVKYFATRDTIFDLHQRARKCLDMMKTEDFESNERFEIDASTKLQEIIAYRRYSQRSPLISERNTGSLPTIANGCSTSSPLISEKICSHRMSMIAQARSIISPMKENLGSLAVRLALQHCTTIKQTKTVIRRIGLVGYNLNIFHILFSMKGVDTEILGKTDGNHNELLQWFYYLIFIHPTSTDHHLPLIGQVGTQLIPFHPHHSFHMTQVRLAEFLTDPIPRMRRFMAAPVALDLLEIWYQIKCSELKRPILPHRNYILILQNKEIIHPFL
jgi:hypothetical protein